MQSTHVFTNITGDIPGAEMFEDQVQRLQVISFCGAYTHSQIEEIHHSLISCLCAEMGTFLCLSRLQLITTCQVIIEIHEYFLMVFF